MVITKIGETKLQCLRCGHGWIPMKQEMQICPKCKNLYFDRVLERKAKAEKSNI
ncbi:MAG: hypothetical protein QXE51_03835 [Nitrososphaeria archaeon]